MQNTLNNKIKREIHAGIETSKNKTFKQGISV